MLKLLPLLFKFAPIAWAFIKEVVFTREDKRYFIRNKMQLFVTVLVMLYTIALYILFEGYNAHAAASAKKSVEIQELFLVLDRKIEENTEMRENKCPVDHDKDIFQDMVDNKTVERIKEDNVVIVK